MLDSLYQVDQRIGESCNTSIFVEALGAGNDQKIFGLTMFDLVLLENMMFSKSPYMHVYALES
jgi:hypothetical protein